MKQARRLSEYWIRLIATIVVLAMCVIMTQAASCPVRAWADEEEENPLEEVPEGTYVRGDANCDGQITALDYIAVKKYILKTLEITSPAQIYAADANADGQITALDYVRIKNIILSTGAAYKPAGISSKYNEIYTYDMMVSDLDALSAKYPELLSYRSLGKTLDGRDVMLAIAGNRNAANSMIIEGSIHGNEYINTLLVMATLEYYLDGYESASYGGNTFKSFLDNYCLYIVPMLNPDGVSISQSGLEGIRDENLKNTINAIYQSDKKYGYTSDSLSTYLQHWKANARGVDVNRNFDTAWSSIYSRKAPSIGWYKGSKAESEAESKAMADLVRNTENVRCALCFHSQGEVLYWACGQKGYTYNASYQLAIAINKVNGFYIDSAYNDNYAASSDWMSREMGIPSLTIESGKSEAPVKSWEFPGIFTKNKNTWIAASKLFEE